MELLAEYLLWRLHLLILQEYLIKFKMESGAQVKSQYTGVIFPFSSVQLCPTGMVNWGKLYGFDSMLVADSLFV
jgi:hypothetical protein